jgi:hypothetical protein
VGDCFERRGGLLFMRKGEMEEVGHLVYGGEGGG